MRFVKAGVMVPLMAVAVFTGGAPSPVASDSSSPTGGVLLLSESLRMAPQPPQLSEEERQAVENKKAGRPYDEEAFNRAEKKRIQTEKYNKERNKQKRRK